VAINRIDARRVAGSRHQCRDSSGLRPSSRARARRFPLGSSRSRQPCGRSWVSRYSSVAVSRRSSPSSVPSHADDEVGAHRASRQLALALGIVRGARESQPTALRTTAQHALQRPRSHSRGCGSALRRPAARWATGVTAQEPRLARATPPRGATIWAPADASTQVVRPSRRTRRPRRYHPES
jgi:hypothetical protein